MIENIQESRFENGLVVLTDRMAHVRSVTLGFFFRTGSRNEPDELNGITHFIEHTVFKGTRRRSALDLAIEQDRLGGSLEAFTTHEETGFAIKVIDEQLPAAFDLLADILFEPAFDERELESEQRVIIEEMKMTDDQPEEALGEIFSAAFFPGHPLGLPITGTAETVRQFDHSFTSRYHADNFTAGNLVIVAAGNVEHSQILGLVEGALSSGSGGLRSTTPSAEAASNPPILEGSLGQRKMCAPRPAAPIVIRQNKNLEQAHLIIATPYPAAPDAARYAADLLTNIVGGGMSSRLWQKIREERGLAYSVGASNAMYMDVGVFSVYAGTSPEQAADVVELAVEELRSVVKDGVTAEELDLAKQLSRASILMNLEDSASRAAALAQSEMVHGRQITVEETLAKINAVTLDDVNSLAAERFKQEDVAFAAIGDLKRLNVDRETFRLT